MNNTYDALNCQIDHSTGVTSAGVAFWIELDADVGHDSQDVNACDE